MSLMVYNGYSQHAVYAAQLEACIYAVQCGFPHLAIADIIDPPHRWFDAALARQVVIHLMVRRFSWPKRRIAIQQPRSRESVNRAVSTIDERLKFPVFSLHYDRISAIAGEIFAERPVGGAA